MWAGGLIGVVEMAFGFFDAGGAPGFGPQGVEDAGDGAFLLVHVGVQV